MAIIDGGGDLAMMEKLGMTPTDLAKRRKMLAELRSRLAAAPIEKPRAVLKKPQPFVMEIGDVFAYPTTGGNCINPYFPSKERNPGWQQDGWAAVALVDRGRAFDFLAWYRPLTIAVALAQKPDLPALRADGLWVLRRPGTCSAAHLRKMELEKICCLPIDAGKLAREFPAMPNGKPYAVDDISIANGLSVGPALPAALRPAPGEPVKHSHGRPYPTIAGLDRILGA